MVLDQVLSSGSNFLLSFVLVRSLSPRSFGAFGVALVTYQLILSLSRAQASEPMAIRFASAEEKEWRVAAGSSAGFALVLSLMAAAGILISSLFAVGELKTSLMLMALILPALLVQDAWRFAFFAQGRPARAAANDLIWAVIQCVLLIGVAVLGNVTITWAILSWGVAASAAAVAGAVQAGCAPRPDRARSWVRDNKVIGAVMSGDLIARGVASQAALFAVGAIAGLAAVGYIRAGLLLFGPLYALIQGVVPFAVGECVRLKRDNPARFVPATVWLSTLLAGGGLGLGIVLLLLPTEWGVALLNENWAGTQVLLPAMIMLAVTAGVVVGPAVGLRAIPSVHRLLVISLVVAPFTIALAAAGAVLGGATGGSWGLALANAITAAGLIWQFRSALRESKAVPHQTVGPAPG